jgi:cytochrome c oxidase assembly factor CtaG
MRAILIVAAAALWSRPAAAHVTEEVQRFAGEAVLLSLLLAAGAWYLVGFVRVSRLSHLGRGRLARMGALFAAGWGTIASSLLTSLHELGGRSFTAHMIEHELLMLLAAPLIALSRPLGVLLWAWPAAIRLQAARLGRRSWFSAGWRSISSPLAATLLQAAMLWLWHAPAFFDRALASEGWHATQHLSLLISALLFWWAINRSSALAQRHGVAAFWLFFTSLHSGLLGALMALAASPWYSRYVAMGMSGTAGLTPLEDQQVAGLIMWIPGGAVHAIVALVYLSRWFRPRARIRAVESVT